MSIQVMYTSNISCFENEWILPNAIMLLIQWQILNWPPTINTIISHYQRSISHGDCHRSHSLSEILYCPILGVFTLCETWVTQQFPVRERFRCLAVCYLGTPPKLLCHSASLNDCDKHLLTRSAPRETRSAIFQTAAPPRRGMQAPTILSVSRGRSTMNQLQLSKLR